MAAYMMWTVQKLKRELSTRGASTYGRKQQLVERLEAYDRNFDFKVDPIVLPQPSPMEWPRAGFQQLQETHKTLLPKMSVEQIEAYFIYRLAGDKKASSDIKALVKGKNLKESDRVLACSYLQQGSFIFFSGIVAAAMKKNVTYNYKIKLEKGSGDPINSECECPAGKGLHSTCKHVAAVLLVLQEFSITGNLLVRKSCTERLQTFNKPRNPFKGSPIKAENLKTKRAAESLHDPRPAKYRCMAGYNDRVRNIVINHLSSSSQDLALRYVSPKANLQAAALDHDYLQRNFTEYWVDSALEVGDSEILWMEKSTRGQASSKQWFGERSWRVTASRFGEITRITNRRNIEKLCSSIASCKLIDTPATLHGKNYEKKAIYAFEEKMNFKTSPCGLFVSKLHPYLGATPDAVVLTDKVRAVVEVKCPYTGRKDKIQSGPKFKFLKEQNNKCILDVGHRYYDQVQGQMYISGFTKCFFVVYTFADLFVQEIPLNEDYCKSALIPKLESFYQRHFRPFIASHL